MRIRILVATVALFPAAVYPQTVKIEAPASISIPIIGDKTEATIRVFYTPKNAALPDVTSIGPLQKDVNVSIGDQKQHAVVGSVLITVKPEGLVKPGDIYSGSVVFTAGTATQSFPVTVTRAKPSFTATALHADICLTCGEPKQLPVQITNTGSVPIANVTVGTITMSDATRRHRWIPTPNTEKVAVKPGEVQTLLVRLDAPHYAGDYATNVELLASDAQTAQVATVVRTRGPKGGTSLPPILFVLVVTIGAAIAHALEGYFGSGGGAIRDKALVSLNATREKLARIAEWATTWETAHPRTKLVWTRKRIADAIQDVDDAIADAMELQPEDLQTRAVDALTRLEKRRVLQQQVDFATANDLIEKVPELDEIDDSDPLADYEKKLNTILKAPAKAESAIRTSSFAGQARSIIHKINWRLQRMKWLRRAVLIIVSLATAWMALYATKCNYGSLTDYITTFFWGLGLTQAGNALISEGTSRYSPPIG